MLSPLVSALLTAALNALGDFFLKQQAADQARTDAVNSGVQTNANTVNQEALNATQRANQAAISVPDVDGMLADLLNGKSI